jgi:hypothetical protein
MRTFVALAVVAGFVCWGAFAPPGRPFSWTMFSGSSKAFLWTRGEPGRWMSTDDLGLTPDAHYLLEADLRRLADDGLPPLEGLIVGSRGTRMVSCDGPGYPLVSEPLARDDGPARLAAALRRRDHPKR